MTKIKSVVYVIDRVVYGVIAADDKEIAILTFGEGPKPGGESVDEPGTGDNIGRESLI
jgi:hypothetical protein